MINNMKVISIEPSAWWPEIAVVITTECGHKHLRPKSVVKVEVGDDFHCYCEDDK